MRDAKDAHDQTLTGLDNTNQQSGADAKRLFGDIFSSVPAWSSRNLFLETISQEPSIEDFVNDLPSEGKCEILIQAYLAGYHTIDPLFHTPSFRE